MNRRYNGMDYSTIGNLIQSIGFPIVACCGLGWFCKYMIDQQNKNIERKLDKEV